MAVEQEVRLELVVELQALHPLALGIVYQLLLRIFLDSRRSHTIESVETDCSMEKN